MIYFKTGLKSSGAFWDTIKGDDWENLLTLTEDAQPINELLTFEALERFKRNKAGYIRAGEYGSDSITNNVFERSILFLDVDEFGDYDSVAQHIADLLDSYGWSYIIYPTVDNGIKPGARLRVAMPFIKPVSDSDYWKIWEHITSKLSVEVEKNMLDAPEPLYVKTQHNIDSVPYIERGNPLYFEVVEPENNRIPERAHASKQVIAFIADPSSNWESFGTWENAITKTISWVYPHSGYDAKYTAELIEYINSRKGMSH